MLVKFHLKTGDTVTLVARNKKGRETSDLGDAIRCFKNQFGEDTPFLTDKDYQARKKRDLDGLVRVASEAEYEYQRAQRAA